MQTHDPEKRLLGVHDVLGEVPISRSKLYELMASGELKTVKVGRRRFVPRAALDAWIDGLDEGDDPAA